MGGCHHHTSPSHPMPSDWDCIGTFIGTFIKRQYPEDQPTHGHADTSTIDDQIIKYLRNKKPYLDDLTNEMVKRIEAYKSGGHGGIEDFFLDIMQPNDWRRFLNSFPGCGNKT